MGLCRIFSERTEGGDSLERGFFGGSLGVLGGVLGGSLGFFGGVGIQTE